MSQSLWPNITSAIPPRGLVEMLYDAAGDIASQTNGAIDFYIDTVGVGVAGVPKAINDLRHNCYLRVVKKNYMHLLFRVTSAIASPFPAKAETPEGDRYPNLKNETELRDAVGKILARQSTSDIVLFLLSSAR